MSALAWVLTFGAVWRLTLLVVADEITRPGREWATDHIHSDRLDYLLTCPWCASLHVAPVVVGSGLAWANGWGWQLAAGSLTASVLTGWLSSFASPDG